MTTNPRTYTVLQAERDRVESDIVRALRLGQTVLLARLRRRACELAMESLRMEAGRG